MKKAFIGAIVITMAFALPGLAAENYQPQQARGPGLEARKAEVLKHIDERIAGIEQVRACVQAANCREDLRACKDKFGPPDRQGGPAGQGRPVGRGGPDWRAAPQDQQQAPQRVKNFAPKENIFKLS